jgi:hypothetical protein
MPYSLKWYRENRIIVGSFQGIITVDELNSINQEAINLVRQGTPPVHDIIDTLALEKIPFDLRLVRNSFDVFSEPNLGWIIVIARNPLFGFFGSTVSQLAGKRFRLVQNWDEALSTLVRVDTSLVDLQLVKTQ